MSLSSELYARIQTAQKQQNVLDLRLWDADPPDGDGVVVTERGTASKEILHLYQLYLEIEDELGDIDGYDEVMQTPYRSAMCIVCELIALLIDDMLEDSTNSTWFITRDGRIFECQDTPDEPPAKSKKRPPYLSVVP